MLLLFVPWWQTNISEIFCQNSNITNIMPILPKLWHHIKILLWITNIVEILALYRKYFRLKGYTTEILVLHRKYLQYNANISEILALHCKDLKLKDNIPDTSISHWKYFECKRPIFLWCSFYVTNIYNVRQYFYYISLEIFLIKPNFRNIRVGNIHNVKIQCYDAFHVNFGTMSIANIGIIGAKCKHPNANASISLILASDLSIFL